MGKTNSNSEHSDDGQDGNATELETVSTGDVVVSPSNSESIRLPTVNTAIPLPTPTNTESVVHQVASIRPISDSNKHPEKIAPSATKTSNTIRSSDLTPQPLPPPQPPDKTASLPAISGTVNKQCDSVASNDTSQHSVMEPPAKKLRVDVGVLPSQKSLAVASTSQNRVSTVGAANNDVSGVSRTDSTRVDLTNALHMPAKSTAAQNVATTTQLLLPDYAAVRQTIKDLIGLLQLYGPLTANQLEYNLPPVIPASIPWSVHEILSILVAIGLVQQVKGTNQYCMFGAIPRSDVVLPMDITSEIEQALNEADDSWKRSQILREALRQVNTNHTSNGKHNQFKDVLQHIVEEYPQVTNDPVYWTALRNCHIDMHTGGPNVSEKRSATGTLRSSSNAASGGTTSKKVVSNKSPKTVAVKGDPQPPPVSMLPPAASTMKAPPISTAAMPSAPSISKAPKSLNSISGNQKETEESDMKIETSAVPPKVPATTSSSLPPVSQTPS